MISEYDILLRLIIAAVFGALVGYERERQNQPAGLRTHIILVVGSALAMTLSINLSIQFRPLVPNGDPARLAAQVLSGIGFLCAGAIFRYGPTVKGLTTATSLWTMAIIGLVVGAGHFTSAAAATAILLIALIILNLFEKRYIRPAITSDLVISAEDRPGIIDNVRKTILSCATIESQVSIQKNLKHKRLRLDVTIKLKKQEDIEHLIAELSAIPGIREFRVT
jgi:putative Mg2+ transporter-C (MgtC) family protein